MRLMIDNIKKQVSIDNVVMPVTSPDLGAGIDNVTFNESCVGVIQFTGAIRGSFTDPSPYQGYVNAWMTANGALTLAQAKAIKSELVGAIYNVKRQAPVPSVAVTAGTFSFDGSDIAVQNYGLLAGAAASSKAAAAAITQVVGAMNQTNAALQSVYVAAVPGGNPADAAQVTPPTIPSTATFQVTPFGSSSPISVTVDDVMTISAAVSSQRKSVENVYLSKQVAIAALSTVAAVTAYDTAAGW